MKRQLTSILLFSALLVGGASTFVSCTDHESDSAYNTSVSLADAIAKQKSDLTELNEWLGKLRTEKPSLADAIDARIKANKQAIEELMAENFVTYGKLNAAIDGSKAYTDSLVKSEIGAIEKLRKTDSLANARLDSALQAQIDTLGKQVNSIDEMQKKMETALDYLVNKNLSNIAINATENPVVGEWNAAFVGSQLNLAAAYYGVSTGQCDGEYWKDNALKNNHLINGKDAGYIYVSLNPTELDPSCITELKLVDSQGNEAKGFKLGDLKETSKVLTYGYTRAASANGFYAIPVTCTDPQNDDFSLNKGDLKAAAKNVLEKLKNPSKTNLQIADIATTLYRSLNNQLKAYTVKVTYYLYDATKGEMVKKTQVAPTYNMAAFAVKPLSFNFAKDNQYLSKIAASLDRDWFPTLSDNLSRIMSSLEDVKFENKELSVYSFVAALGVTAEEVDGNVVFKNGNTEVATIKNATVEKEGETTVTIGSGETKTQYIYKLTVKDDTMLKPVIDEINNTIAGKLQPAKDVINAAMKYTEKYDNYVPKLNSLLKKITSNIANANRLLQPTLLYVDQNDNWNFVSTANHFGSRFTGTGATVMVATTYTAEYLAPAYKKSIYVEGAKNGAAILVDGKEIKEGDTFSGNVHKIVFNAPETGDYTIVYKAVDYSGVEVEKKFYITVK